MTQPSIFLFAAFFMTIAASASAADNLCTPQEDVIFSCTTGKKIASVCASKNLSKTQGYIQYRFGKKVAPELNIPKTVGVHPSKFTNGNNLMFSGGGGAYLRIINGTYGYVLYTGIGKGWQKDGVAVEKDGKLISSLLCKDVPASEIGSDFFQKAGIPEDQAGFDIP